MNNVRPITNPSIAGEMLASLELLNIVRPDKIDCQGPQPEPPTNRRSVADIIRDIARSEAVATPNKPAARIRAGAMLPAEPWKPKDTFAHRQARFNAAAAFLKARGILVSPNDRDMLVRKYWVTGQRDVQLAEDVIAFAIAKGWAE